jgi:hypothetical protein
VCDGVKKEQLKRGMRGMRKRGRGSGEELRNEEIMGNVNAMQTLIKALVLYSV